MRRARRASSRRGCRPRCARYRRARRRRTSPCPAARRRSGSRRPRRAACRDGRGSGIVELRDARSRGSWSSSSLTERAELVRADAIGADRMRRQRAHAPRRRLDHAARALRLLFWLGLSCVPARGEQNERSRRPARTHHFMTIYATRASTANAKYPDEDPRQLLGVDRCEQRGANRRGAAAELAATRRREANAPALDGAGLRRAPDGRRRRAARLGVSIVASTTSSSPDLAATSRNLVRLDDRSGSSRFARQRASCRRAPAACPTAAAAPASAARAARRAPCGARPRRRPRSARRLPTAALARAPARLRSARSRRTPGCRSRARRLRPAAASASLISSGRRVPPAAIASMSR